MDDVKVCMTHLVYKDVYVKSCLFTAYINRCNCIYILQYIDNLINVG